MAIHRRRDRSIEIEPQLVADPVVRPKETGAEVMRTPADVGSPELLLVQVERDLRFDGSCKTSTEFQRTAIDPTRNRLVSERLDAKDKADVFNYNVSHVIEASSGTSSSRPLPTLSTFIPHHLPQPSTWLNSLPSLSATG